MFQVDSIVGREIEVGGIYRGVVSSVKEYGAFVEFNGGQQGLLHISELSHEQVLEIFFVAHFPLLNLCTIHYFFYVCLAIFLFIVCIVDFPVANL